MGKPKTDARSDVDLVDGRLVKDADANRNARYDKLLQRDPCPGRYSYYDDKAEAVQPVAYWLEHGRARIPSKYAHQDQPLACKAERKSCQMHHQANRCV